MTGANGQTALALGGGGARAAYQAGVLRALAARFPSAEFPILTGVSAGAINAAIVANHVGYFPGAVDVLTGLWSRLEAADVFRATPMRIVKRLLRTGAQLAKGVAPGDSVVDGVVDTSALREFLRRELRSPDGSLPGTRENLRTGRLGALAITATRYATGEAVTFCAGREVTEWNAPRRRAVAVTMTLEHVMASSALPLFYPSVAVDGAWYGDGEIGLVAPLAPAIHLGAGRILAISTWFDPGTDVVRESDGHPPPGEVVSALHGAVFSDRLDEDARQIDRVNRLVRALPPGHGLGYREVELLVIRPSVDLGAVACEPGIEVPTGLRFLARRLDLARARSRNLLSVVLLHPSYLRRLIEIGEADGLARAAEIERFLAPGGRREGRIG